jgi:Protein of unknown function (DUF2934)
VSEAGKSFQRPAGQSNRFRPQVYLWKEAAMDQIDDDPRELERRIQQASRIASKISDQTTVERLTGWISELRQRLRRRIEARRTKDAIQARAREIWEQNGRPLGRDLEFWLQAETEIISRKPEE